MRAGVLHAPGDLRVEERPEPEPAPGEVVVEVSYNGLCGTDATEYSKGPMMVPLEVRHPGSGHVGPTVLGHEFVGRVVSAAAGSEEWVGRRVASGAGVSCGECTWCRRGRTQLCATYYTLGLSTHGGLAERVAVPASTLVGIPDPLDDRAAALAQPLAVGMHAVSRSGAGKDDTVLLLGAGAIGSFILAGLVGRVRRVVVADIDQARLDAARAMGADDVVLVDPQATAADLPELTALGAEVVVESSGAPGAAQRAFSLAARGGSVLLVGLTKAPQPLLLADLVLREVDVRTTVAHVCGTDLPAALTLLAETGLGDRLVDRVVPLEDVVRDGLDPLLDGSARGKVLVDPRRG